MPRMHGGHTELGTQLNNISQRTDQVNVSRLHTKKAILYKSYKNQYVFYMKLLDDNGNIAGETGPIPIVGSSNDLVSRYGSPEEMENQWEVLISYRGTSINRGTAQITKSVGGTDADKTKETEQTNQLRVKGVAFAPPGPGV